MDSVLEQLKQYALLVYRTDNVTTVEVVSLGNSQQIELDRLYKIGAGGLRFFKISPSHLSAAESLKQVVVVVRYNRAVLLPDALSLGWVSPV